MKKFLAKKAISLALAVILLLTLLPQVIMVYATGETDQFKFYVDSATEAGLIPSNLKGDLDAEMTFGDIIDFMLNFSAVKFGVDTETILNHALTLTSSEEGAKLAALNEIIGGGITSDDPDSDAKEKATLIDILTIFQMTVHPYIAPFSPLIYDVNYSWPASRYNFQNFSTVVDHPNVLMSLLGEIMNLSGADVNNLTNDSTMTRRQFTAYCYMFSTMSLPKDMSKKYPGGISGYQDVDDFISSILDNCIKSDMTDEQKFKAIYDYMIYNVTYDENSIPFFTSDASGSANPLEDTMQFAYPIIATGKGTCDAFANVFRLLVIRLGFECNYVSGQYVLKDGTKQGHGWDQIKINDQWYWFDTEIENVVYYGQKKATPSYSWYMKQDSTWIADHQWDQSNWPAADGTKHPVEFLPNNNSSTENLNPNPEYNYDTPDPADSIILSKDKLTAVTDEQSAIDAITSEAQTLTADQKASPTGVDLLTLFSEEAVAQAASTTVTGGDITVNQADVQDLQTVAATVTKSAEQALVSSGITPERDLRQTVKFKTDTTDKVTITVEPSAVNTTADYVRIETPDYAVSLPHDMLVNDVGDSNFVITIERAETTAIGKVMASLSGPVAAAPSKKEITYKVTINKNLTDNITYSFPPADGDVNYQTIMYVDSGISTAVVSKYNPATGKIDAKIKKAGTYVVRENKKSFSDLTAADSRVKQVIEQLASKGIINGTSDTMFNPNGTITRAELTALIMRALSKVDDNTVSVFTDVKKTDWFYDAINSAKKYNIVNGMTATTFAPSATIQKDQIVAVVARTLRSEMKYKNPNDTDAQLKKYSDKGSLHTASVLRFLAIIIISHFCLPLRFFTLFTWCIASGTSVLPHNSQTLADNLFSRVVRVPAYIIAVSVISSLKLSLSLQSIYFAKVRYFCPCLVSYGMPQSPLPIENSSLIFLLVLLCLPARVFRQLYSMR